MRMMTGIVLIWLVTVAGIGASGVLYSARGPVLAPFVLIPVLVFLAAFALAPRIRAWTLALDPRTLVLLHLVRFVGVAFLILHAQGKLPAAFALPAGWGDIVVAATAPLAAFCAPARTALRRRLFVTWNVVGLVDVINAVLTALRLRLRNPADMAAITGFPLSLVPTFVVPMIFITHFILVAQLWRRRSTPEAAS